MRYSLGSTHTGRNRRRACPYGSNWAGISTGFPLADSADSPEPRNPDDQLSTWCSSRYLARDASRREIFLELEAVLEHQEPGTVGNRLQASITVDLEEASRDRVPDVAPNGLQRLPARLHHEVAMGPGTLQHRQLDLSDASARLVDLRAGADDVPSLRSVGADVAGDKISPGEVGRLDEPRQMDVEEGPRWAFAVTRAGVSFAHGSATQLRSQVLSTLNSLRCNTASRRI
jgi:hypothetical protein